jgi:uncharacterized protein YbcI
VPPAWALPSLALRARFTVEFGFRAQLTGQKEGDGRFAGSICNRNRQVDVEPPGRTAPLQGGRLLAAISTSIVAILRDHYGRGPMKAKTYALDDIIVVVMRGSGFTPLEETIMQSGQPDRVVEMRHDFQRVMTERYTRTIEELTGRKVRAFLSQAHVDPDITMEIFFMDQPLESYGAAEIINPHQNGPDRVDRSARPNP